MAPSSRPASSPLNLQTPSAKQKKERILQALNKLNDRDTQRSASEELALILHDMDPDGLPALVACLCTTASDQKVYARKEVCHLLGLCGSMQGSLQGQVLQPPLLGRIMTQLKRALQDADGGVREAAAEGFAQLAKGLQEHHEGALGGGLGNPVVKLLLECIAEQKVPQQGAAALALGLVAPYIGTLDASLAKDLVKRLASPIYLSPANLLAALGSTAPLTLQPSGLIKVWCVSLSAPAAWFKQDAA
ncbi:MAG: hypothetical protein WDW38_001608 [Sanguina aurantia]